MSGPRNSQSWITDPAIRMGFEKTNRGGVCYAEAHVSKQLIREGRINELDNTLKLIEKLNELDTNRLSNPNFKGHDVLRQIVEDFQGKSFKIRFVERDDDKDSIEILNKKTNISQRIKLEPPLINIKNNKDLRKLFNNLYAFYNEMELFFHSFEYTHLFEQQHKMYHQDYRPAEALLAPKALKYEVVASPLGRFDQDDKGNPKDLIDYVQRFMKIIYSSNGLFPVEVFLESGNHAIFISYEPNTKELILTNANKDDKTGLKPLLRIPVNQYFDIETSEEIKVAKYIQESYFQNQSKDEPIYFSSMLSVPENEKNNPNLKPHLDLWKEDFEKIHKHKVAFATSKQVDPTGVYWVYIAARNNDEKRLKQLLQNLADPNVDYQDFSPLYVAADKGHVEAVKILLTHKGINVEKGFYLHPPLYAAASNGHTKVVQALIDHGAKVDPMFGNNETPIFIAASRGFTDIVKILLDKGASIKHIHRGKSLLIEATRNGHADVVKLLLESGADLTDLYDNKNALHIAAEMGHLEVVKVILQHNMAFLDKHIAAPLRGIIATPLEFAIANEHLEVAEFLRKKGAKKINDQLGKESLGVASNRGNTKMVKLLLDHGVDYKSLLKERGHDPDADPKKSLRSAVAGGKTQDITLLCVLSGIKNINEPIDDKNNTLLGYAVERGNIASVKFLCENTNADIHTKYNGEPLLWHALRNKNGELIQYLLEQKAPAAETLHKTFSKRNDGDVVMLYAYAKAAVIDEPYQGESLLQKAVKNDDQQAIQFLISSGANYIKFLKQAIKDNNMAAIQVLLKNQKVNNAVKFSNSLIETALKYKETKMAIFFIDMHANINRPCSDCTHLLSKAASLGNEEVVKYLIQKGASIGKTIEELVRANDSEGIQVLKKCNVDINTAYVHFTYRTALDHAAKLKSDSMIKTLVTLGAFVDEALSRAVKNNDQASLERLLPYHGIDKPIGKKKSTLLALAANQYQFETVKFLLNKGANVKEARFDSFPLVYLICVHHQHAYYNGTGHEECIKILKEIMNKDPTSAAESLYLLAKNDEYPGIELLLAAGVKPDVSYNNQTALYVAAEKDHYNSVRELLKNGADSHVQYQGKTPLTVAGSVAKGLLEEHEEKIKFLQETFLLVHKFYTIKGEGIDKLKELVNRLPAKVLKDYKDTVTGVIDFKTLAYDIQFQQKQFASGFTRFFELSSRLPMLLLKYSLIEQFREIMQSNDSIFNKYERIDRIYRGTTDIEKILEFNPKRALVQLFDKVTQPTPSSSSSSTSQTSPQTPGLFQPTSSSSSSSSPPSVTKKGGGKNQ